MCTLILANQTIHEGNLILINAIAPNYPKLDIKIPSLLSTSPSSNVVLDRNAATVLAYMFQTLNCEDQIVPVSGYRPQKEQQQLYDDSLKLHGADFTRKFVARPNHSEHQSGLAIDLSIKKEHINFLCPEFPYEGISDLFRKKAPHYGFIQRYEQDKESITNIGHEPWHFRYVGYPHSLIMAQNHLSLEEYIEEIKKYPYDKAHLFFSNYSEQIEIFYIPLHCQSWLYLNLPKHCLYQISGNNLDGFIITLWRNAYV